MLTWLALLLAVTLSAACGVLVRDRRTSHARVADRARWLDAMFAAAQDPVFTWDIARNRLTWGMPFAQVARRPCVELNRIELLFSLLVPVERDLAWDSLQAALRAGEPVWSREVHLVDSARPPQHCTLRIAFGRDPEDDLVRAVGTLHLGGDVRSEAEEDRGTHGLLQRVLDAMPDPVALLDAELRFVAVNTAFGRLVEVEPGLLLGRRGDTVVDVALAAEMSDIQREVLLRGERVERDEPWIRQDGRVWRVSRSRIVCSSGQRYLLASAREVTAVNQARAALRGALDVAAVGTLMASFAHGGNNRLTVIMSCIDILNGVEQATQDQRKALELAHAATRHLAGDLASLLSGTRRIMLPATDLEVRSVVIEATRLYRLISTPALEVTLDLPVDLRIDAARQLFEASVLRLMNLAQTRGASSISLAASRVEVQSRSSDKPALRKGQYCCLEMEMVGATLPERFMRGNVEQGHLLDRLREPDGLEYAAVEAFVNSLRGHTLALGGPGAHPRIQLFLPLSSRVA